MTLFFQNHQITIYRNRKSGSGSYKAALSATFTAYYADIQPASDSRTEFVNGRIGATFTAFVETTVDIKEGDQIVTEDGKHYSVRGVAAWSGAGLLDHKELTLVSQDG